MRSSRVEQVYPVWTSSHLEMLLRHSRTDYGLISFLLGSSTVCRDLYFIVERENGNADVVVGWLIYLIWGEMEHWLVVRQEHLINPAHSKLPQANTVLVTGIHMSYMDEDKLAQLFSRFPGGVKRIWLNRYVQLV